MIELLPSMYEALRLIPYITEKEKKKQFGSPGEEFQTKQSYADIYAEDCVASGNG